ncbi:MAG: phosphopantothenoylcysteine decarboxylase [Candidatus Omnitrophica bacterium]|nr:phosphopantothenoylcysteine decarboxylase [Candidatus Omnitrophota bacterium]
MHKTLKGKKVLITAGPTWVPIDRVRVLSNLSSGRTGIAIAGQAAREGASVTLLLGPIPIDHRPIRRKLNVIRFNYFDELRDLLNKELARKKYDIIVHGAAVSDYKPLRRPEGKINSGLKGLTIRLRPTSKIINIIRKKAKGALLVMFKLESGMPARRLIEMSYKKMRLVKADMIVANNIEGITGDKHQAYIIDKTKKVISVKNNSQLARALVSKLAVL